MKNSKFLTRHDVGTGVLGTIQSVSQMNVAKDGAPEELKWVMELAETEKPMVLNSTNAQLIAMITGSEDTDNWPGKKIVLYDDPTISFAGKLTGGIRVRAPKNNKVEAKPASPRQPEPKPAMQTEEASSDDVPF